MYCVWQDWCEGIFLVALGMVCERVIEPCGDLVVTWGGLCWGLIVPCDDLGRSVPESGWTVSVALPCKTWVGGVRGV